MSVISSLIEHPDQIEPNSLCGSALDLFLDHPDWDLAPVVDAGRLRGVVTRGLVARGGSRPVAEVMAPAVTLGLDANVDEACALLLSQAEPAAGLVVLEAGRVMGVVSARALLRVKCDHNASTQDSQRFIDLVSRELRTPMGGVLAVAELLERQPLPVDALSFVRTIIASCHNMAAALDDALELSRADSGLLTLEPRPTRLRDLMDQIQTRWDIRASQDGVTLAVAYDGEPDLMADIDPGRLEQLFDGLIGAALIHSRQNAIEASLRPMRTDSGLRLIGRVRDSGGSLAASFNGRPGAAAANTLSLTLVRRIVERLSGEIRAEANVGAGATIVFELPAAEALALGADSVAALTVRRSAHVLVVDDNATNRMVAEALCEMFDCTSECVEDGVEAVEAARTGRFDLVLMDIRMPRMDGVEATRAIRALPGPIGQVPIIALTANADPEDAKGYIASGMHSVVEKPIKPEQLQQAINAALPDGAGRAAAAA